jgi:hypothetical protein
MSLAPVDQQVICVDIASSCACINHMSLSHQRKPCFKVPMFSTGAHNLLETSPIRVAPKPKCRKRLLNVFLNNRGFPDQSDDYDHLLHGVDSGPILRKLRHPQPDPDAPLNPLYYLPYVADKLEALMGKDMDSMHLDPTHQEKIYKIICDHWSMFNKKGVFVPVKKI